MRKFFLLIPAMLLTIAMNAKEIEIGSGTSNIIHITIANAATEDGDVLVLTDVGPYLNSKSNKDDYTKLTKNITIKAADGLESKPVIKFEVPFESRDGKSAKFIGIKFDGASLTEYDNYFHFNDAYDNSLEFEDCEFTGVSKYLFYISSGKKAHSIAFDNCSIHDNSNRIVYNNASTIDNLSIVDSEISGSSHYIIHNNSAQIGTCTITDCDIHGCTRRAILNEAGNIDNIEISNSKFYSFTGETIIDNYSTSTIGKLKINGSEFYSNSVDLIGTSSGSHADSCIIKDCLLHDNTHRAMLQQGTIDAINITGGKIYNFTVYAVFENYTNATLGNIKIDGTEFYGNAKDIIGSAATSHADSCILNNCYFHNNSRSAVYFEKSSVSGVETCDGVIIKNSTFANNDLSANSRSVIDVFNYGETAAANIEVTVDHCTFYNNTTANHDYSCIRSRKSTKVTITNSIFAYPTAIEFYATNCYGGTISNTIVYNLNKGHRYDNGAPAITNTTTVNPRFNDLANNNYTFDADWSTGSISPAWQSATDGTHLGDPRWYSDNEVIPSMSITSSHDMLGTKAQLTGDVKLNASDHIEYKGTATPGTVKWKMHVNNTCAISAVAKREAGSTSGCTLTLTVKNADGNNVGALVAARSEDDNDINFPGTVYIPEEGDYTLILTNSVSHSSAILEKIILSYAGGAVQTITNADDFVTDINEAWFSSNGTRADGKISFPGASMANAWARWNVHVSNNDYYDVTVNFDKGDADHNCGVKLYNELTTVFDKHATTSSQTGAASPIRLGRFYLPAGDYVMEFTNPVTNSTAKLISVEAKAFVAPVIALPNTLPAASAITSELAYEDGGELYFTPSDRKGYILDQWVKWKVCVAAAGAFLFTMDVNSDNEQSYKITILDSENNELDFFEKNPGSGEQTIKHYFNLAAGNYFVMVQNTTNHSAGHIVSLVVTKPDDVVIIDEEATDNTSWSGYVVDPAAEGPLHDVQIKRTIVGGMYNTLCLPFEVTSAQAREIFGSDVQLRTLNEATIEEGGFVLNLDFTVTSSMYPGTPHLIKTSRDIVDPVFIGVKFTRTTPAATTKTKANFVGNFVKGTIAASENNLFLGAENTLYFPTEDIYILGMRAYFVVHDVPAYMIKRARIVENEQVITEIELVKSQEPKANNQKLLIDGQLIIVRDGVRYNVMGTKVQ